MAFREHGVVAPESSHWKRARARGGVAIVAVAVAALVGCEGDQLTDATEPSPGGNGAPNAPASLEVDVELVTGDRIERTDSILIRVEAWDPNAVRAIDRVGFTAIITHSDSGTEVGRSSAEAFSAAPGDTVSATFSVHPDWLSGAELPSTAQLEIYGWGVDSADRCAAATSSGDETHTCESVQVDGSSLTIATLPAPKVAVTGVPGRTTPFPTSTIVVGDLQVDTLRSVAYLSNRLSNHLHVFRPNEHTWGPSVTVGSEPWGLHLNAGGDTLLVANSGGTSVSRVALDGAPREIVTRRVQTRNTALFEVDYEFQGDSVAVTVRLLDFSDRPQYLSQDASGRLLYSTRPTGAAPRGSVRIVTNQPGWEEHDTRMLARIPMDVVPEPRTIAILNADSVRAFVGGAIEVWDHPAGFPSQPFSSGIQLPFDALRTISADPRSDVEWLGDSAWELSAVSFADTTYVATSEDREFVAFGDGGEPEVGRVVMWNAAAGEISSRLLVADLVNNASERVQSLDLNRDGSLGMARGAFGSYFFSTDLRLRGTVPELSEGGGGGALHPDHPATPAPGASTGSTLAFTISGDRSIRIMDTVHYTERGRILIRDSLRGATLRVTPPFPSDNNGQGRACGGSSCVVAKVFAVTAAGGIVVVDVRASDISAQP